MRDFHLKPYTSAKPLTIAPNTISRNSNLEAFNNPKNDKFTNGKCSSSIFFSRRVGLDESDSCLRRHIRRMERISRCFYICGGDDCNRFAEHIQNGICQHN